jgi:hypothetical protein
MEDRRWQRTCFSILHLLSSILVLICFFASVFVASRLRGCLDLSGERILYFPLAALKSWGMFSDRRGSAVHLVISSG